MPTEKIHQGVEGMKLSVGEMLKSILFGLAGGIIASLILLNIGDTTDEVIYGASVPMTRFFVTVVCTLACLVSEMSANTSAREVGVDIVIALVVSIMFVGDSRFLNHADKMVSIENLMGPITVCVVLATMFSEPIGRLGTKLMDWIPFQKKDG